MSIAVAVPAVYQWPTLSTPEYFVGIYWPSWLDQQVGLTWASERKKVRKIFLARWKIVDRYAAELEARGKRVTHDQIRIVLKRLGRDYKANAQAISRLLHQSGARRNFERYANGHRVKVLNPDGTQLEYGSLNEAAGAEGRSPESIRKWATTRKANNRGQLWSFVDGVSKRSKRRKRKRRGIMLHSSRPAP
jgi:hypothetical protein